MWLTYFEDVVTTCYVTDNSCGCCDIITLNEDVGLYGHHMLVSGAAPVCLCSCWCGPFHFRALCYQSCCSGCSQDEKCVAKTRVTLLKMLYVTLRLVNNVFQQLLPARGCQIHWHFCPVSQAISSPSVTVNTFSDTAHCLRLQICAVMQRKKPFGLWWYASNQSLHLLGSGLSPYPEGRNPAGADFFVNCLKHSQPLAVFHFGCWLSHMADEVFNSSYGEKSVFLWERGVIIHVELYKLSINYINFPSLCMHMNI